MASANHLRHLALAAIQYSEDHKGQLPAKFPDDLKPYLEGGFDALQSNPRHPDRRPGYVYVRPAETIARIPDAPRAVLFYEAHDPNDWAEGINVAYADGHVELVKDRQAFEQSLKQPAAGNAKP